MPRRVLPAAGLFFVSLLPGLVAFLPGFSLAVWNFTDPIQQNYLTPVRVGFLSFLLVAVFAPFVAAAAALLVARARTRSWTIALRAAAVCAGVTGVGAFFAVMLANSGF